MTNINTFQGDVFIHEYIKHIGDDNNLFGFSGTDTFKIATAGSDRLTVDSNGYVHFAKGIRLPEGDTSINIQIPNYIYHTGDENTYFGFNGNDSIVAYTNGSQAFEIDSSQYLYMASFMKHLGDNNTYFGFDTNDSIVAYTNGNQAFEIDSSQYLYMPSFMKHLGDNDTYFGFDTNDSYVIATANNTRFSVNSSGQVHIYDGSLWIPDWVRHYNDNDCYFGFGVGNDRFDVVTSGGYRLQVLNNGVVNIPVSMTFGSQTKQMIGMYGNDYGLGVSSSTWYARSGGNHAFYRAGNHHGNENNAGGGSVRYVINRNNTIYNYGADYTSHHKSWSGQGNWDVNVTLQGPNGVFYHARCIGWPTYSSRKLKENFEPLLDSLDKVKSLNGLYYTWKEGQGDNLPPPDDFDTRRMAAVTPQKQIGFIADEVAEVLPYLCTYDEDGVANGVDYSKVTPVLVEAIKELDIKIGKSEASSDDRLKDNETYIKNATKTIMKLKPQTYDKKESFTSNIYTHEAGLIAQDIWYDTPELRFVVKPGLLSQIPDDVPTRDDDPRVDPDYSKWGPNPASVDYNYIIPYALKSIQEIATELPKRKTQVIEVTPSNIDQYRSLTVCSDTGIFKYDVPVCSLSKKSYDINCFGVISTSNVDSIDNEILIDTHGPGKLWVINTSNILSGDYLTTSNIHGYSMKQNDDILHNYTVAKSTIDCDFIPTQINSKRIKQKLTNVTHYVKTKKYEISKEEYDGIDDKYKSSIEYSDYQKENYVKVSGKDGWHKMEYYWVEEVPIEDPGPLEKERDFVKHIISVDDYALIEDSNTQNLYSVYYSNLITSRVSLEDYATLDDTVKAKCEFQTKTIYHYNVREESADPLPGFEAEIKQVYMNDLDENDQIQWEDTGETIEKYSIRYLDGSGNITDESNHVYKAALIGCTYNCT
tara:strand:+ start:381 stop:3158 length:2778 start_codon:yes stop_codon:yes gene_type:complete